MQHEALIVQNNYTSNQLKMNTNHLYMANSSCLYITQKRSRSLFLCKIKIKIKIANLSEKPANIILIMIF